MAKEAEQTFAAELTKLEGRVVQLTHDCEHKSQQILRLTTEAKESEQRRLLLLDEKERLERKINVLRNSIKNISTLRLQARSVVEDFSKGVFITDNFTEQLEAELKAKFRDIDASSFGRTAEHLRTEHELRVQQDAIRSVSQHNAKLAELEAAERKGRLGLRARAKRPLD